MLELSTVSVETHFQLPRAEEGLLRWLGNISHKSGQFGPPGSAQQGLDGSHLLFVLVVEAERQWYGA